MTDFENMERIQAHGALAAAISGMCADVIELREAFLATKGTTYGHALSLNKTEKAKLQAEYTIWLAAGKAK